MKIEMDKEVFEKIINELSRELCPSDYGFKDRYREVDGKYCGSDACKECWKEALGIRLIKE